jgi:hypothetical protein
MPQSVKIQLLSILMILSCASLALGASVTVIPSSSGNYSVQGDTMNGVAGIQLDIAYDAASLASPTVSKSALVGNAMFAVNTSIPGLIKLAIVSTSPFTGSGSIATISFASQSGTGGVTSVKSTMIDNSGAAVASQASIAESSISTSSGLSSTAGLPFTQPNSTAVNTATSTSMAATPPSSLPTYLGTVIMPPGFQEDKGDSKNTVDTPRAPEQPSEPMVANTVQSTVEENSVPALKKTAVVKKTSYKGILETFHTYEGEKTPALLIALFKKELAPNIRQQPVTALSDGKTIVQIIAVIEGTGEKSLNFALDNAKLISLNRGATTSTWIIELLPQAGVIQANLTILTDSESIEYPLTLSPPVDNISTSEADFALFLRDSGAADPKRDLNLDAKHDYVDDFVYSVNYLARKGPSSKALK